MSSTPFTADWRRARSWAAVGAIALLATSLSACGSDSDGATSGASSSAGDASSALAADVAALSKPADSYPVPTDAVGDISSVAGRTIYYVPVTLQAPQFSITLKALTAAAGAAGLKVQTCDGKGTPTDISACISQATKAKAGAIVTDAIPYGMAANAFAAAGSAKIPVIISNQIPDDAHPAADGLAYIGQDGGVNEEIALAKWTILDSGKKAQVLINQTSDGPSPAKFVAAGEEVYKSECPDCKTTINPVTSSNFNLVPSSTSAALLKDPNITYVESQFEQFLQPTTAGVQQTSRNNIKITTGAAQLSSVKAVQNGSIAVAAGQASAYQGWVDIDAVLRMMLGKTLPEYSIPVRLFTKDSGDEATETAQDSGAWYGPTTFTDDFKKLWGLA